MDIPIDVARAWGRAAAKWCGLFVMCVCLGALILWLAPDDDESWPILLRFSGLLLVYGGAAFGWATGTLAAGLLLYARMKT